MNNYTVKQFDKHSDAYTCVRSKIHYPESLYLHLSTLCHQHRAALDIGCGNGLSTVRLKPYFEEVTGVDISKNLIAQAKDDHNDLPFYISKAEDFQTIRPYDLITSATSFYWMDKAKVTQRCEHLLTKKGIFCAYKYDFPIVYGPLRDYIESELSNKWSSHRDRRLINYDDSIDVLQQSGVFNSVSRTIFPNIIELTPEEVALFFLSTSYVTQYIDRTNATTYRDIFLEAIQSIATEARVKVNFDVHAYIAQRN